jgi:hypothetical protein
MVTGSVTTRPARVLQFSPIAFPALRVSASGRGRELWAKSCPYSCIKIQSSHTIVPLAPGEALCRTTRAEPLTPPSLPEPVARFIERDIHSVLQLEILLLLREHVGDWTPARVASELRITEQSAELHLVDLSLRGLASGSRLTRCFRYAPRTAELSALVGELADCYANMRYTVINLIFSVPGDSARALAEAFRFRRKKDD